MARGRAAGAKAGQRQDLGRGIIRRDPFIDAGGGGRVIIEVSDNLHGPYANATIGREQC